MNTTAVVLVFSLALAGCAASRPAEQVDGRTAYHVECSSSRLDLCYAEAKRLCPGGYDEVKQEGAPPIAPPPGTGNPNTGLPPAVPNAIYVSCK